MKNFWTRALLVPCLLGASLAARAQEKHPLEFMTGHSSGVPGVLLSDDGSILWSAGRDHTVRRWDTAATQETGRLYNVWLNCSAWALSPDASVLAIAYLDGTVKLFDGQKLELKPRTLDYARDKATSLVVNQLVFSTDGSMLVAIGSDQGLLLASADGLPEAVPAPTNKALPDAAFRLRTWTVKSGATAGTFEAVGPAPVRVAFNADNSGTVTADSSGQVIERTLAGEPVRTVQLPRNGVLSARVSALTPDGSLALGDIFGTFETVKGLPKAKLGTSQMRPGRLRFGAFSNEGKLIVGATDILRAWAGSGGKELYSVFLREDPVLSVALAGNGSVVAMGHASSAITLRNAATGKPVGKIPGGPQMWEGLQWAGEDIVTRLDTELTRWNGKNGTPSAGWQEPNGEVTAVALSPDGTQLALAVYAVAPVTDPNAPAEGDGTAPAPVPAAVPPPPAVAPGAEAPADEGNEAAGPVEPPPMRAQLRVLNTRNNTVVWSKVDTVDGWIINRLSFTDDSGTLIAGGARRKVEGNAATSAFVGINAYEAQTGDKSELFFLQNNRIGDVAELDVNTEATRVLGADDKNIYVWELPTGNILVKAAAAGLKTGQAALSLDGQYAAHIEGDGVTVWDTRGGKQDTPARHMRTPVPATGVAFTGEGDLAAVDEQGNFWLWKLGTLTTDGQPARTAGEGFRVDNFKSSRDGKLLAGTGSDGRIRIWDANGALKLTLVRLPGAGDKAPWIGFTPDGYFTGSKESDTLIRWKEGGKLLPGDTYLEAMRQPTKISAALTR